MSSAAPNPQVMVGLGITKNIGNYESFRLDISEVDFVKDGETSDDTFQRVYALVESRLQEKLFELNEALKND